MLGIVVIALGIMLVLFIYARSLGKTGQTWGRKIVGIRVVDKFTEQPIGFGRALGRTVFANLISSSFLSLGYLWMLWDTDQQTWHDKVVGSIVVAMTSSRLTSCASRRRGRSAGLQQHAVDAGEIGVEGQPIGAQACARVAWPRWRDARRR